MTNIQEKITNLSPEKQELLKRLIAQKNQANQIIRHEGLTCYPASFSQTRFLFLEQLQLGLSIYNNAKILKFNQNLNINALEKALEKLILRHETLRSKFIWQESELKQVIVTEFTVNLPLINIKNYDHTSKQELLDNLLTQEMKKSFNFEQDLMFRYSLFKTRENEYFLLLVIHHIISDNWSANILTNELLNLYNNFAHKKTVILPDLPIQYGDYSIWQKEQFAQTNYQKQLKYWQNKLAGELPILNLPIDKVRPIIPSYQGKSISFLLPENLTNKLKRISIQEQVTLFMLFLTSFKVLLYRYTNEEDIIVGTPILGRQRLETENLIGCFLNTLALRDSLGNNPTFKELLQQVKNTCLEAYENQDLPFEKIIEDLQPERNLTNSPVFQVMFNFPGNSTQNSLPDCQSFIEIMKPKTVISMFDLSLAIREKKEGLKITFNYSCDLLQSATIERMIGHFQTLLTGIVNNPNEKIVLLPILTEAEKKQILIDWNNTQSDYPKDKCIHQLFEEQVIKNPHNIAAVYEAEKLTYQELNEKANQLAHYLQQLGIKPDTLVAICVEKSLAMIIGILAILKAGGAYVPLDPNYPQERVEFMLNDSQISILLTQEKLVNSFQFNCQNIIKLDTDWDLINREKIDNLITEVKSNNLAYVIYTSGSTGTPKGVMIEHRSVANMIWYRIFKQLPLKDLKAFAFTNSLSFDVSVIQIFPSLIVGGKVIIVKDLAHFTKISHREKITFFSTLPSVLENYLTNYKLSENIEAIGLGGEKVSYQLIEKLSQIPHIKRIYNSYGPTETTVASCSNLVFSRP